MMNFSWDRKVETWVLWTEDGLHFVPLTEGEGTFVYGIDVGRLEWRFGSDSVREKETIR